MAKGKGKMRLRCGWNLGEGKTHDSGATWARILNSPSVLNRGKDNEQGQGYCPHYHDHFTDDWEEYRKIWIDESDNDCHTESRFHCYEFEDEEESKLKTYRNKLENGHLFFNCVPCANKVLSGNYIFDGYLKYILISFMILFI